ncbi:type II CRISPR RNA-guided endonuclease Cas9 [Mucilaginibacter sp. L3T2-6]|uniref:type II CRISPR RNA-guided endonuclease Cas9 n=1 Tax=Mucilaginibacter sp. L3T2-6 TaxID=3062491 RepID=UPI0026771135|nr:type II CRISPR RNA-guided endonuclease Cas9 [Mucilaginibacter sp. L3T2-6]MDO3645099.1 type II CRISPR RNA-guided endonuclease Cas9 [Mucilaginibacter sp. L3T2-6]MDV6217551.1 type II CRISPR RNA-guided endonuclease Cas9 [Mucilaginibacter sp. L3T2-6]
MKKILGLDIGTNSIGWALVQAPNQKGENYAVRGVGVRIIPLSADENDEFTKGNAISKNAGRTLKRGARRNLHRYKLRRHQLTALLNLLGMMPDRKLFELDALNLYSLRAKGVTGQLTLQEIGRVFYHLNQKRGYKSNRKANNEDDQSNDAKELETIDDTKSKLKKKGYLDLINDRERALKDGGLTIGQHFYNELIKQKEQPGSEALRIKENIYLRNTYIDEFDKIWEKQQEYYSNILTEVNKQKIRNEIIYYQRPLRSQKGLVSNCLFEKHHKASPKSSPLFQVSKIWQELNNIELTSFKAMKGYEDGFNKLGKRPLTLEEKQRLFNILTVRGKLSVKDCLKELGYKSGYDEYKLNIRNEKELEGNRTYASIEKVFDHFKVNRDDLLKFDLSVRQNEKIDKKTGEVFTHFQVDATFEAEPLFQLWHLIYSAEETETLTANLQKRYGFTAEVSKALARIDFQKQGYGSLSSKALRNILPHLQLGLNYADACKTAGYNHSASITGIENELRKLDDKLELYPKNSLRQPVVEKIINQVINLVNDIIDEKNGFLSNEERYARDKFEIRVELARELRQSTEERNRTYSRNSRLDRRHKEIIETIKEHLPYKRVTKNDIERYKLWEEFGKVSPYEPEKPIPLGLLFSGEYDIEHIIPKSRLFDDSFTNKTICPRRLNSGILGKNQMTAYDFMKSKGDQAFNNYLEFIKTHLYRKDGISKGKFNKLMMPVDKIPEDFINRQLQETRFIVREVRQLLTLVCRNVYATSGPVTDYLRHHWGYDLILQKLNWHKYEGIGKTIIETDKHGKPLYRIIDWSKRDDHRHHAVDAIVIASTEQSYIQQLNNLNQVVEKRRQQTKQDAIKEIDIKTQIPFTFQQIHDAIDSILVSFKPGKKVSSNSSNKIKKAGGQIQKQTEIIPRGFLHKDTVYGRIKQFEDVALNQRFDRITDVADPKIKAQLIDYIGKFDNNIKEAFNSKNLLLFKEQSGYDRVIVYRHEHVVRYKLDTNFKVADVEYIVDHGIKAIVKSHLSNHGNNAKEAFKIENPVWLNKDKGIPVRSVRCFTGFKDLQALHTNEFGEPIDFVSTRNNHHIAIYKDEIGRLQENTVSFWDAVKRRQAKLPIIIKHPNEVWDTIINSGFDDQELLKGLPKPGWVYQISLQQNEMFVFGLTLEDLQSAINDHNYALISKHLYRVQKMSKKSSGAIDIWFRHHLETKLDDSVTAKRLKKYLNIQSLNGLNGIKVKVNNVGQISEITS